MKAKSIIQQLKEIERTIYDVPYDDLTDYLKGIRDMVNLLNGEEDILETVLTSFFERIGEL